MEQTTAQPTHEHFLLGHWVKDGDFRAEGDVEVAGHRNVPGQTTTTAPPRLLLLLLHH